jgi:hypothetical protein
LNGGGEGVGTAEVSGGAVVSEPGGGWLGGAMEEGGLRLGPSSNAGISAMGGGASSGDGAAEGDGGCPEISSAGNGGLTVGADVELTIGRSPVKGIGSEHMPHE